MKKQNESLFSEHFMVWKDGPETPSVVAESKDEKLSQSYFNLHEYMRFNYDKLNNMLSDQMTADPENEGLKRTKDMLDKVVFDPKYDPANVSIEDMKAVKDSVMSGSLERLYRELAPFARAMLMKDIDKSLGEVGPAYSMVKSGVIERISGFQERQSPGGLMVEPRIETLYEPKTRTTKIRMTDPTTGKIVYEKSHEHPFPNENPNLGSAWSEEAGSIEKIDDFEVMVHPKVEKVYDPESNSVTLKFFNPVRVRSMEEKQLLAYPFWVINLEAIPAK